MFVKSDLVQTFASANKSGDSFLKKEVIISKIGELLAKDRPDIIKLINSRQISVNAKDSDETIINTLMEQIKRSDDVSEGVIKMILKKDQKSDSFFKSKEGIDIVKNASVVLKLVANDNGITKTVCEAKKQHNFFFAEGDENKVPSNWGWNAAIAVGVVFICWKLYQINNTKKEIKDLKGSAAQNKTANVDNDNAITDLDNDSGE